MSERRPNEWLYVLVRLQAPLEAEKAAEGMAHMIPALNTLPAHKLTDESAIYVASRSKRVPSFGAICGLLDEWVEQNKPKLTTRALPPPDDAPHAKREREEQDNRASWQNPVAIRATVRTILANESRQEHLGKWLGKLVAKYAPQNLGLIPPEWHPSE